MRLHRFYIAQPLGEVVVIQNRELIHQWKNVFRYKEGDQVILFNGEGYDTTYLVQSLTQKEVTLTQIESIPSILPKKKVFLYISLVKKDTLELIVQKASELGVSHIVPILSERSEKKNLREDRLGSIAIESAEQCGRGDILIIENISTLNDALTKAKNHTVSYVFDTSRHELESEIIRESLHNAESVGIFIGPEGGWSDSERELFKQFSVQSVSLGKLVLRAETAAIIACAYAAQ